MESHRPATMAARIVEEVAVRSLTVVQRKFLLHWGEMSARWGLTRTVAQVHALLYLSDKPLNADQLVDLLGVSRSGLSGSLHELQNWRLVKVVHVLGDRRDHFQAVADPEEMFAIIVAERKRREVDPILAIANECLTEAAVSGADPYTRKQLLRLQEFSRWINLACERIHLLSLSRVAKLLGIKRHKS